MRGPPRTILDRARAGSVRGGPAGPVSELRGPWPLPGDVAGTETDYVNKSQMNWENKKETKLRGEEIRYFNHVAKGAR